MSDDESLEIHCFQMAYLLGVCIGSLSEIIRDKRLGEPHKQKLSDLLSYVSEHADKIGYNIDIK